MLNNKKIQEGKFPTTIIQNCIIKNFEWERVYLNKGTYENVTFERGVIRKSYFETSKYRKVIFKNVVLEDVDFSTERGSSDASEFNEVVFENCKLTRVDFSDAKLSNMHFISCKIEGMGIVNTVANLVFENTDVTSGDLAYLKEGSCIHVNGGFLELHADLSKMASVQILNVSNAGIGLTSSTVDKVELSGKTISLGLTKAKVNQVSVKADELEVFGGEAMTLNSLHIESIKKGVKHWVNFLDGNIGELVVKSSNLSDFKFYGSKIGSFRIENSQIRDVDAHNSEVNTLTMNNTSLNGSSNFDSVKFNEITANNVTISGDYTAHGAFAKKVTTGSIMQENVHGDALIRALTS